MWPRLFRNRSIIMPVYHIRRKSILPDSAFFSISSNGADESINFNTKSRGKTEWSYPIQPKTNRINNSITFHSNGTKPKTYQHNTNIQQYNINSLIKTSKSLSRNMLYIKDICPNDIDQTSCSSCSEPEDKLCVWSVEFTPEISFYRSSNSDIENNSLEYFIDEYELDVLDGPLNVPNNNIQFSATFKDNENFDIYVYIKTKCKEVEFNFSGNTQLSDSFTIPNFDPTSDHITDFIFSTTTENGCSGLVSYENEQGGSCTTTTTTTTPTPYATTPTPTPTTTPVTPTP